MSLTTKFTTPRLLIIDYYDSLINRIDKYTEQLLEQYGDEDILPNEPDVLERHRGCCDGDELCGEKYHQETYFEEYNYDNIERQLDYEPGVTKVRDYFNRVRSRQIDAILKVRDHNLESYEMNKLAYKNIPDNMNKVEIEHLKSRLFADKFCFLFEMKLCFYEPNKCIFQLYLVVTDFYMIQTNYYSDLNM
jgi:hypothetical protein